MQTASVRLRGRWTSLMVTTDELILLLSKQQELVRRVSEGNLTIERALATTQDVLDEANAAAVLRRSWWGVTPEMQIEQASAFLALHGRGQTGFWPPEIPAVPAFAPRTPTELLLLAVYLPDKGRQTGLQRTFDAWWDFIVPPTGLIKWRWDDLKSDSRHLRLADGIDYKPGIRWVAFDPSKYQGKRSPKDALAQSAIDGTTLAHAEVLMAAAMFPEWVASWNGGDSPHPNLSGLQFYWKADWSDVPCLGRWVGHHRLKLAAHWADDADSFWSSPVVREC